MTVTGGSMEAPLKITGIDHVVLHVKDLARAKKFYVDFLGMEVERERSWQLFLKCGAQGVALFKAEDEEDIHGGSEMNHMALRLKAGEYEKVRALLESNGIEVTGRPGDPECVYFSDPDGHRLQLLMPGEE
jgi:catechol 2,3-dioxygenase-like lactoylglutathione lyase family enzyme